MTNTEKAYRDLAETIIATNPNAANDPIIRKWLNAGK